MMSERFWWSHDTREEKGIFFQAIQEKEQSPAASSILIFNCPKEFYELFVKC